MRGYLYIIISLIILHVHMGWENEYLVFQEKNQLAVLYFEIIFVWCTKVDSAIIKIDPHTHTQTRARSHTHAQTHTDVM